ncbi:hypothetical protein GGR57DRAFT_453377 [Xylariaceae sp. FL1272]|nr:hypothetical protein GGR57DRAFT_453377 [Xylariaceae sp. FL1272]
MGDIISDTYGVPLPSRYEIRRVGPEFEPWLRVLSRYIQLLDTRVFGPMYKNRQPVRKILLENAKNEVKSGTLHCLKGGMSYAIFDKEYKFKRPESVATGGGVYWHEIDPDEPGLEATGQQRLLDAMDFPPVAMALSFDKADKMPSEAFAENVAFIPEFELQRQVAEAKAKPAPDAAIPEKGEVLVRAGTATRREYTGQGLMKALSHFVMHDAHARGFKRIEIDVIHQATSRLWLNPPLPYRGELVNRLHLKEAELEIGGKIIKPFVASEVDYEDEITVHLTG